MSRRRAARLGPAGLGRPDRRAGGSPSGVAACERAGARRRIAARRCRRPSLLAGRPPAGDPGRDRAEPRAVRDAVRADDRLRDLWVEGEVGRVTVSSAGHAYFTLKDERSQLSCVWFRDDRISSPFEPRTGLRVVAHGRIDVFEQQGVYQLYVSRRPAGRLRRPGPALRGAQGAPGGRGPVRAGRKRPLPVRPRGHRRCHELERRGLARHPAGPRAALAAGPGRPRQLPGPGRARRRPASSPPSTGSLATPSRASRPAGPARHPSSRSSPGAAARSRTSGRSTTSGSSGRSSAHPLPVVCGVGHETDVTLADFAADVRAPDAVGGGRARRAGPGRHGGASWPAESRRLAGGHRADDRSGPGASSTAERRALDGLRPADRLAQARERAGVLLDRATRTVLERVGLARTAERTGPGPARPDRRSARLGTAQAALDSGAAALAVLGPQATLDRGYAIVRRPTMAGSCAASDEAPAGPALAIRLACRRARRDLERVRRTAG